MAALRVKGFYVLREGGEHTIIQNAAGQTIAIPRHRELKRGTVRGIAEDAGIEWSAFRRAIG